MVEKYNKQNSLTEDNSLKQNRIYEQNRTEYKRLKH